MENLRPMGLALSGGGFRATAFHLGFLKRLREKGRLSEVNVLSTVSGGSILGAYWVHWQARRRALPESDDDWNHFERSVVDLMRAGVRERVTMRGLIIPTALLLALCGSVLRFLSSPAVTTWVAALLGSGFIGYLIWHYTSTTLLAGQYDRYLFNGALVSDLDAPKKAGEQCRNWPRLVVNCASLNTGHLVVFTPDHPQPGPVDATGHKGFGGMHLAVSAQERIRDLAPVPMPSDTPLARVVAASSCVPGVFRPVKLRVTGELARLLGGHYDAQAGVPYFLHILDGGVFDNQGAYLLSEVGCRSIIISDAGTPLPTEERPSAWALLPLGRGVVSRASSIVFERSRQLGLRYLAARDGEHIVAGLEPQHEIWHVHGPSFDETIRHLLASVRTDLDRFSDLEIAALMVHGYAAAGLVLRRLTPSSRGTPGSPGPIQFADKRLNVVDWQSLLARSAYGDEYTPDMLRLVRHLEASGVRFGLWRSIRRTLNRLRGPRFFELGSMGLLGARRRIHKAILRKQGRGRERLRREKS